MTNKLSHITDKFIEICLEQKKLYAERDAVQNWWSGSEDFVQNSNALDKTFDQFKKTIPLFNNSFFNSR